MRTFYVIIYLFSWNIISSAQNLVPNPSFEDFYYCPPYPGQILAALAWDSPNNTTTDYFHRCAPANSGAGVPANLFGTQAPRSGNGYAGIRTWIPTNPGNPLYREYLAAELRDSLQAGTVYEVSFWVSPAEVSSYYSDDIGIYFSDTSFMQQDLYRVAPQLRHTEGELLENLEAWKQIHGFYTAKGGEKYILIGNFLDDEAMTRVLFQNAEPTVYYYIDDIVVKKCEVPDTTLFVIDTFLCKNQAIQIGGQLDAHAHRWNDDTTQPFKTVSKSDTYILKSDFGCYQIEERYQVSEQDCACSIELPTLIFNFQQQKIKIKEKIHNLEITIYDIAGRKIRTLNPSNFNQLYELIASGMYVWQASFNCQDKYWTQTGKLIFIQY